VILHAIRQNEFVRVLAAFVVILAVFAQSLVPHGWMPTDLDGDGYIKLSICAADSEESLTFASGSILGSKSDHPYGQDHNPDSSCPFSATIVVAILGTVKALLFAPLLLLSSRFGEYPAVVGRTAGAHFPLGSRAPPLPL